MQAKITNPSRNARNYGGEKETVTTMQVIARNKRGELAVVTEARFYMGRSRSASNVYCSLWVHCGDVDVSGTGTAGGYGYHKESAALQSAITSAGIELYGDCYARDGEDQDLEKRAYIGGVGSEAMRSALLAIARAAGADCSEYLIV